MFKQKFLFTLLLFGIGQFVGAEELQWLQYHSSNQARQIIGDIGTQYIKLDDNKPEGVELPEFKSSEPIFAKWKSPMANDGFIWMALDQTNKNGAYDSLFIDSDCDGDLSDETAITPYRTENNYTYFGSVKIVFEYEEEPITYHLNLDCYSLNDRKYLYARSGCWYEGSVTVAGEKKHCVLIDQNTNGRFNDKSNNFNESDRIRIGKKGNRDTKFTGNYIEIDGQLYRPEIAIDGAYIKLSEAKDVVYGNIQLHDSIKELSAGGENGLFSVSLEKGAGKLPVGKYRIHHWLIERKDEKKNTWKLKGQNFFGDRGLFDVTENGQTDLAVGEPLICRLDVQRKGSQHNFMQALQGKLGERIEITRNGSRGPAPKLHIECKKAKYDRTFTFEYG